MNILFLTTHFNPGGISSYTISLARSLRKRHHKIFVASSGGSLVSALEHEGSTHVILPIRTKSELSPKVLFSICKLKRFVKQHNIDVIHAQTRVTQVVAFWVSKITGIPFVATCHGFFKPRFSRRHFPCWGKKVVAISKAVQRHLIDDFAVDAQSIELVYNGIDIDAIEPVTPRQTEEFRKNLNLQSAIPTVGIIARLSSVKGHSILIQAVRKVIERGNKVQLLIVGDGGLEKSLIDLTQRLHIENSVFFAPSNNNLSLLLSAMDVFVMPSLQEGLGLSIMEAQARGLAVIASKVGGIPELVVHYKTGLLVSAQDVEGLASAIVQITEDKALAEALGNNAREHINAYFSLTTMAEKMEALYNSVLKN
ncbi:glycosyltransferase family 4 protein [Candidatus Omnitrophota bacterium]